MTQTDTKNSKINQEIARQLRALRGAHELTLDELAEKSGISLSTLKRELKGMQDIPVADAAAIAGVMGKTLEELTRTALSEIGGQDIALDDVLTILASKRSAATVSPAPTNTDDLERKRLQRLVAAMSVEELEKLGGAATRDAELDSDEPDPT